MANDTKVLLSVVVLTVVLLVGGIFFLSRSSGNSSNSTSDKIVSIDYTKGQKIGSDSAKVKLVEFADLQCPACANTYPLVKSILDAKLENFQYIFRHFPLAQHKNAEEAANFAEFASESGKFWEVEERLFNSQTEWEDLSDPSEYFSKVASELGLDPAQAREAIKSASYKDKINADLNEGISIGVNSTPTFYLNGRKVDQNSIGNLKSLIEEELKR